MVQPVNFDDREGQRRTLTRRRRRWLRRRRDHDSGFDGTRGGRRSSDGPNGRPGSLGGLGRRNPAQRSPGQGGTTGGSLISGASDAALTPQGRASRRSGKRKGAFAKFLSNFTGNRRGGSDRRRRT